MYAGTRIGSQSISTSSSATSACWPGFSETLNDFRRYSGDLRVGLIEHFLLHTVHLTRQGSTLVQKVDYLLAYVRRKSTDTPCGLEWIPFLVAVIMSHHQLLVSCQLLE